MPSDSPDPDSPPTRSKRARTRARILDHAGSLFAARGFNETSVESIAEAADVSIGSVYKHFGSKIGLAVAWIDEAIDTLDDGMRQAHALDAPLDRIYAAGDAYFHFVVEHPAACRFLLQTALRPANDEREAELRNAVSKRVQQVILGVATDVRQATSTKQAYPAPTDELIVMLWGLWNGVAALMVRADDAAIPPALAQRAIERFREIMRRASAHAREHPEPPPGRDGPGLATDG